MRVGDAGGLIAAEEARVWVQRGRLVYHKLTTLSAMATEGVTAGWQFLEDGDEMRIGPYRLIFQAQHQEDVPEEVVQAPDRLPQEHGMALRPTGTDSPTAGRASPDWNADASPPKQDGRRLSLHDFNTPGQDGAARTWGRDAGAPSPLWGGDSEAQPPSWGPDADEEEAASTWGGAEDSQVSRWGVVEEEQDDTAPVEWASDAREPDHGGWSFSDQTAASEWTSESVPPASYEWNDSAGSVQSGPWAGLEPRSVEADHGADPVPESEPESASAGNNEEAEFGSWQSGEWGLDADAEDED
jgi:hypothetical protein